MKQFFLILIPLVVLFLVAPLAGNAKQAQAMVSDGKYAIVVNSANTYAGSRDEATLVIRQLYLKERAEWPAGTTAKPFGAASDSPEHAAFVATVLGMTEAELAQHWIALKQKTGQTPPREVSNTSMLGKFVSKYEGAFTVVAAEQAATMDGVKILFQFD